MILITWFNPKHKVLYSRLYKKSPILCEEVGYVNGNGHILVSRYVLANNKLMSFKDYDEWLFNINRKNNKGPFRFSFLIKK